MDSESFNTPRLILRELLEEDAEALFPIWSDIRVTRYMKIDTLETLDQAREVIRFLHTQVSEGKASRYVIILKDTNEIIGSCGFETFQTEHRSAKISYELGKHFWGKGFASEALRSILADGFKRYDLHRVEARIEPENDRSIHALHKLGFMREGRLRDVQLKGDRFVDQLIFSLLREEIE
ncbi:GNAT family N-acetyltransferase [Shouchella patagoniensis]|uniref:GNAT family N-acetyltransferase n=1 Tax=Shouchella patagoniensis TaxID=228576 RepID=UPI001475409D|nr:GNAT family protein [Shouchella patagoniensis]